MTLDWPVGLIWEPGRAFLMIVPRTRVQGIIVCMNDRVYDAILELAFYVGQGYTGDCITIPVTDSEHNLSDLHPNTIYTARANRLDEDVITERVQAYGDSVLGLQAVWWTEGAGDRFVKVNVLTECPGR